MITATTSRPMSVAQWRTLLRQRYSSISEATAAIRAGEFPRPPEPMPAKPARMSRKEADASGAFTDCDSK